MGWSVSGHQSAQRIERLSVEMGLFIRFGSWDFRGTRNVFRLATAAGLAEIVGGDAGRAAEVALGHQQRAISRWKKCELSELSELRVPSRIDSS